MIIVRLWGGIGNQLFQYAYGRFLENTYKEKVYYDANSFNGKQLRQLELSIIDPTISILENNKYSLSKYTGVWGRLARLSFMLNPNHEFVTEKQSPQSIKINRVYYFQGYWQEKKNVDYINNEQIDFSPKEFIPKEIVKYVDYIRANEVVSIHIRRGDYFTPKYIGTYGVCDRGYYLQAVDKIRKETSECVKFFVFTDDPIWVQDNLKDSFNFEIVENYPINNFWYIYLMSLCKHNILSNSSFSWWGAYLNSNPQKRVICPKKWTLISDKTIALDLWEKI